jgi:2-methylcitrate dehydratase PrpD
MQEVITKPYPVNGFAHSTIDAAVSLREQGFRLEPGARLTVGVAGPTLRTIAEPRDEKLRPATSYAARFSGPILAALALRGGSGLGVGLRDFPPDLVADEELLAQAGRVEIVADEERTSAFPQQVGATAHAVTADGQTFEAAVTSSLGGPGRPLSPEQHRVKFDDCVHHGANGHAAALWRLVNTAAEGSRDAAADIIARIIDRSPTSAPSGASSPNWAR